MKFRNIIGCSAALLMTAVMASSIVCFADQIQIANANKGPDYYTETSSMLPEGCKIEDAAYVGFKFTGYVPDSVANGALVFNTENGSWNSQNWGSDNNDPSSCDVKLPFAVADYPDAGAEIEIIRPVDHNFDDPGRWSQVAIQQFYGDPITITDVYFLDSNKQLLTAKTATTDAPVTEAAPAATTTVTTSATTAKAAATTTTKSSTNPSTGDPGVGIAVTSAMAAAGVAITFRRKRSE